MKEESRSENKEGSKEVQKKRRRMHPLKLLWRVAKKCQFDKILMGFSGVFLLTSIVVAIAEPGVRTIREGLWYTFVACSTIGFGDIAPVTFWGRGMTIIVTVYEIIVVALISGVIVSYYLELVHRIEADVMVSFVDKLEHLTELDRDELQELEDQVKELTK